MGGNAGGPNTVLRVIVESLLYPVSLDILYQIFQRFGKVLKIVTFTKNNSFQVGAKTENYLFWLGMSPDTALITLEFFWESITVSQNCYTPRKNHQFMCCNLPELSGTFPGNFIEYNSFRELLYKSKNVS